MFLWSDRDYEFNFAGDKIELTNKLESLGMMFDKNCKNGSIIKSITDKLKHITAFTRRNFVNRSPEVLRLLYNAFFLCRLGFVSIIWNTSESAIKPIVREFKAFWRLSPSGKPPNDILWPKEQLLLNDIVFMWKIVHKQSPIRFEKYWQC